jgi:hypothetical protein
MSAQIESQLKDQKQLNELDQMLGWDFTEKPKGDFEENAVVPDGWYLMELVRIGKPYLSKSQYGEKTKCVFEFVIQGEADKKNQPVESEYAGGRIPAFVNIEARDPIKSTMYPLTSALLGQDAQEWSAENGPVHPSMLVGKQCWVRVNTTANDKGEFRSFLNEFKAELPKIQFNGGNGAKANGSVPMGTRAQQPPAMGKSPF